ncbi:MAG: RNA-binding protein, partial [Ignavibacteriales bacterium]|nr:RNA-binding protein [Ignavibacteriales bacterium]
LFEKHGEVKEVKLIRDFDSGEMRGFGFVQMSSESEGQAAIDSINGSDFEGSKLTVNVARPKKDHPRGGRNDRRGDARGARSRY